MTLSGHRAPPFSQGRGAQGAGSSQGEEREEDGSLDKAEWPKPVGAGSPRCGGWWKRALPLAPLKGHRPLRERVALEKTSKNRRRTGTLVGSLLPPLQQPDRPPRLDEAGPPTRDRGRVGAGLLSSWDGRERCREATEDWKVRSEPPWRRLGQPRTRSGTGRW